MLIMNPEFLEIPLINLETRARSENAEIRWKLTNLLNGKIDENDGTRAGKTGNTLSFYARQNTSQMGDHLVNKR